MESDRQMSAAWIMVPLFQILSIVILVITIIAIVFSGILSGVGPTTSGSVFALAAIVGLLVIFLFVSFVLSIFFAVMLYRLVSRRNNHFARQLFIYEDLEGTAKELAAKKGIDVSLSLDNLRRLKREAQSDEISRDAALWSVILVFAAGFSIPSLAFNGFAGVSLIAVFAQYYVYYFLMKDWFRHERREDIFVYELARLFAAVGINLNLPRRSLPTPDRSFVVYLVLTIVTLGFFGVYWVYVLLTDPNNHLQYQAMVEDTIMAQMSPVLSGTQSPPPPPAPPPPM